MLMLVHTLKERWNNNEGFQKYFKNTSWLLVSRILCMVISFLATAFIARKIGPTNSGQLSYALSFVAIFSFLPSLGVDTVLYRDLVKYKEKRNYYLGSALGIKLISSIITVILIITSVFLFGEDDVSRILIFILSLSFIFNSFLVVVNDFQARVESKYLAVTSVIVILLLNLLKISVILLDKGVIYLALVLLSEPILYALFYFYFYKRRLHSTIKGWRFDKIIAFSLVRESWPFIFSAAFVVVYARIDQVFLKHIIDSRAVGLYDAAVRLAETWYFIPGIIINSLFPALVNAVTTSPNLYKDRLRKIFIFTTLFTFIVSFFVTFLASDIMDLVYGSQFIEGVKVLQIYIWSSVPLSLTIMMNNDLVIEGNRKLLLVSSLLPMVINIILNLLWIPMYGITGSAFATLVSYSFGPLTVFLFKETRQKICSFF